MRCCVVCAQLTDESLYEVSSVLGSAFTTVEQTFLKSLCREIPMKNTVGVRKYQYCRKKLCCQ
jgi:hypothetical protein